MLPQDNSSLENMEFVDHLMTFEELGLHLKSQGCHVANFSSIDFSLKNGIGGCLISLLSQFLDVTLDAADISFLASWYAEHRNYDNLLIVIIDDLERCNGSILSIFILMLRKNGCNSGNCSSEAELIECVQHFYTEPLGILLKEILDVEDGQSLNEAGKYQKIQLLDTYCEALNPGFSDHKSPNIGISSSSGSFISQMVSKISPYDLESYVLISNRDLPSSSLCEFIEINDKVKELQSALGIDKSSNQSSTHISK
ncbi:hypothetical protein RJ641_007920 [Dillenia turbinata]|uniref:Origin recognition complex subunit 3 N-terminal domain-containing protein n=1 Tax=Dillenia turbinata TaxID=194707 RepID=A0AAN8V9R9_9MAGN